MSLRIGPKGLALVKFFEGCRLKAYLCSAGVPTLGWGATGKDIKLGMTWTQEQADARLVEDLRRFERGVEALVDGKATPGQFSALVAFAFNVGIGALTKSTLLKRHNAGKFDEAAAQFLSWDKARVAGQMVALAGLTKRRKAEAALYRSDFAELSRITGGAVA